MNFFSIVSSPLASQVVKKTPQPTPIPSPTVFLIPALRTIRILFLFFAIFALQAFLKGMVVRKTAHGREDYVQKGRGTMIRSAFTFVLMIGLFFLTGLFLP